MNRDAFDSEVYDAKTERGKRCVIYCDVDETLISSYSNKNIVKPHVLKFLKYAKQKNCIIYLWSAGGAEYCKEIAEELGISDLFDAFLEKPDICIDDLYISADFIQHRVHPKDLYSWNKD